MYFNNIVSVGYVRSGLKIVTGVTVLIISATLFFLNFLLHIYLKYDNKMPEEYDGRNK